MVTKETHKMALRGKECLKKAVHEELKRKALLGQYVIITREGKTCRVSAKEALKMTKAK
jgi:hypothetical protein